MSDKKKKTSWEYQKEKNYKQVKITFNLDDPEDSLLYHYISNTGRNRTALLKKLIRDDMWGSAYEGL